MQPGIILSNEQLAAIHLKVYNRYGYPTLEAGLRAFKRIRKYAENKDNLQKIPPAHLKEKLAIWARINKEIKIAIYNNKEALQHGTKKHDGDSEPNKGAETRKVIQVLK